jgi:hypothetical protein
VSLTENVRRLASLRSSRQKQKKIFAKWLHDIPDDSAKKIPSA